MPWEPPWWDDFGHRFDRNGRLLSGYDRHGNRTSKGAADDGVFKEMNHDTQQKFLNVLREKTKAFIGCPESLRKEWLEGGLGEDDGASKGLRRGFAGALQGPRRAFEGIRKRLHRGFTGASKELQRSFEGA